MFMFRYRRYRAFIAFAVIFVLTFYYFSGFGSLELASAIGAGSLKEAGVVTHDDAGQQKYNPPQPQPQVGPGSKPVEEKERVQEHPDSRDPLVEQLHTAPTSSSQSSILLKETSLEQQGPPTPRVQETSKELASAQTSIVADKASYNEVVATKPPHVVATQEVDRVDGEGHHKATALPSIEPIHWSKQIEHFPVSRTIQIPSGTPKPVPKIQYPFEPETSDARIERKRKLQIISDAATHSWKGYRDNAWGHDEVRPVTGGFKDPFCGWAATLVDALDTLWIMGMKDEFEEAVRAVGQIDFTTSTRKDIPLFETTIRYLGGLVSAYDISDGQYVTLLDKAVELAEILMGAFDTPNRMPVTYYHWMPTFASQPHRAGTHVVMSEMGSLSMEFTRLAQITKEPKYYDAIDRITDAFYEWQQRDAVNSTLVPGLFPTFVDASGCEKPAQIKIETLPYPPINMGNDDTEITSQPIRVDKPVEQGPLSDTAKGDKMSSAQRQPGQGKIVGWGDPIEEGALDSKAAKDDVLQRTGSNREHQAASVKPIGNIGKAVGWDDGVEDMSADNKVSGQSLPNYEEAAPQPAKPVGKMGKIAGWEKPIEEGSLDSAAAKKELYDEIHRGADSDSRKRKRQLGGELAAPTPEVGLPQPETAGATVQQQAKPRIPALTDADICLPRGLISSAHGSSDSFGIGGMADSTYEYLPKQCLLLGGLEPKYKQMYESSMDAVIDKLLFRPMTPENHDILFAGEYLAFSQPNDKGQAGQLKPVAEHLTCFAGAMFALGGKIFDRKEDVEIGAKLTQGCVWAYNATASGIMPERALLSVCESKTDCIWNETKYWEELDPAKASREAKANSAPQPQQLPHVPAAPATKEEAQAQADTLPKQQQHHPPQKLADDSVLTKRQVQNGSPGQIYPDLEKLAPPAGGPTRTSSRPGPGYSPNDDATNTFYEPPTHEEYVQTRIWNEALPPGFTKITSRKYILRPEAIESVFYMYRITGSQHWREVGWQMFVAIQKHTHTVHGHSALLDVTSETPGKDDTEESFWLAETLKYFFLLFSEESVLSLDDWVLNTEAHPFRRPDAETGAGKMGGVGDMGTGMGGKAVQGVPGVGVTDEGL